MENNILTKEEIAKIAPGYRGKPKNFDPSKAGQKRAPRSQPVGPKSPLLPRPSHLDKKLEPTPQKNHDMLADSIFGSDVGVNPIVPHETFTPSLAKVIDICNSIYNQFPSEDKFLDRNFMQVEFQYYGVAMTWFRMLDIKVKQGREALTPVEELVYNAMKDKEYSIPQPLYLYLVQLGTIHDKNGKTTELSVPPLPVTVIDNLGGYHAAEINVDNHTLFEEVPSLGIIADVIMGLGSQNNEVAIPVRVGLPEGSVVTSNLLGYVPVAPIRRPEIRQRLQGLGITEGQFREFAPGTRLSFPYLNSLSDKLAELKTFRMETVCIHNLTQSGSIIQSLKTKPLATDRTLPWSKTNVQVYTASHQSSAAVGAAITYGFQLFKEAGPENDQTLSAARWNCVTANPAANQDNPAWVIPAQWIANRNARRQLPAHLQAEVFRSISMQQEYFMECITRKMIKTSR